MEHTMVKRGFTLLELLISIAIIGILVSLGVVSYAQAQRKTRDSRRRSDMKAAQSAWEQYYADHDAAYPTPCSIDATYLPAGLPVDPKNDSTYTYTFACPTNTTYCFCARMESDTGNATNTTCSYGSGSYFCVNNLQ